MSRSANSRHNVAPRARGGHSRENAEYQAGLDAHAIDSNQGSSSRNLVFVVTVQTLFLEYAVAERIRAKIKAMSFRPDGNEHVLTVSAGGAAFSPLPGFAEMFKIADRNLYEAKHGGRDRVAFMSFDEI
ncbi:diguanylate cyclase (plasmid) [Aminobacter sp. SR38]|jgi:hypothetical protein|uniref:GGDEF domain-containing protein n=1 Tax=Aminobacter sp. SR38 TaxID=2774562 RepID=UPI001785309C|nr:diguanylate cyclase [Aminobacter sp. SR38]QOF75588.1 diguanylate cyclase [Aminobacter sp. SR38]